MPVCRYEILDGGPTGAANPLRHRRTTGIKVLELIKMTVSPITFCRRRDRIQLPAGVENLKIFKIFMSKVMELSVNSMGLGT